MTLRLFTFGVLLVMLRPFPSEAQTPLLPDRPAEPAVPPSRTAAQSSQEAQNADLETYLRARLAVPGPQQVTRFKALHATETSGVVAVELENSWLRYHVRIMTAEASGHQPPAYRRGDSSLDDILAAFAGLQLAPRARVETSVRSFGLVMDNVYIPASPPHFNNAKGIVWVRKEHRFVLSTRGIDDAASNRCFKGAIDLSSGDVITRVSVPCSIQ